MWPLAHGRIEAKQDIDIVVYEGLSGDFDRSIAGLDLAKGGDPDGDAVAADGSSSPARALYSGLACIRPTSEDEAQLT